MGFRTGSYATIWEVKPASDVRTNARISISKKDKQSGQYTQDFSGYVSFLGTVAAKKALGLKEKDRIRLGDVDVTTKYDPNKQITYTNFNIFSFDGPNELTGAQPTNNTATAQGVDSGEIDDTRLPF